MEPLNEAPRLLRRQAEIENAMRGPGGIRVTAERELHEIRQTLTRYPGAVRAILETASRLKRPADTLSTDDIDVI